ncbi:response regulator transcription factor [Mailhella sp.]|uniref:response regulator transcription factor n=1 Tax=Mailhella sp. TaxID=1981029 RepID=UPI004064B101
MRNKPKILIVEDDAELRDSLVERLSHGFQPVAVGNDREMFAELNRPERVDAILLDVLLPGEDGLSLCRELRKEGSAYAQLPIIMVSALGDPTDRVAGLHAGADDYITKPFFTAELIARIQAVLRRSSDVVKDTRAREGFVRFGEWVLDRKHRSLKNDSGLVIVLTQGDYRLLCYFLAHPNQILSRETLLENVESNSDDTQNINVRISRLRAKLGDARKNPIYIQAFRNEGYMWKMPVRGEEL